MKAIQTRFIGPTNTKPARHKAFAEGVGSLILSDSSHEGVARRFRDALGWKGTLTGGWLPNGDMAWTFNDSPYKIGDD